MYCTLYSVQLYNSTCCGPTEMALPKPNGPWTTPLPAFQPPITVAAVTFWLNWGQ